MASNCVPLGLCDTFGVARDMRNSCAKHGLGLPSEHAEGQLHVEILTSLTEGQLGKEILLFLTDSLYIRILQE